MTGDIEVNVYLDDERQTPDGWVRVYWPEDAIRIMETVKVTRISLDHDLGPDPRTGYDVLKWIEEQVYTKPDFHLPLVSIHTANPSARKKMQAALDNIRSIYAKR